MLGAVRKDPTELFACEVMKLLFCQRGLLCIIRSGHSPSESYVKNGKSGIKRVTMFEQCIVRGGRMA